MLNVQILLSEMKTTAEMNSTRGKYYSCDGFVFWMLVLISAISFFYFLSEIIGANVLGPKKGYAMIAAKRIQR